MRLSRILERWRYGAELTLKAAAEQIGIPLQTLSRIERGGVPDGETLARILVWLVGPQEKGQNDQTVAGKGSTVG